jgi:uncharacterized sporulation protein YeaH/YhbH (DUF444 family)
MHSIHDQQKINISCVLDRYVVSHSQTTIDQYLIHVNQYNRHSTLMTAYRHLMDPKFMHYVIREKSQVYHALKHFFQVQEVV